MPLPQIDPSVRHMSVGQLRKLDVKTLAAQTSVVEDGVNGPILVVVPYPVFLEMQELLRASHVTSARKRAGKPKGDR
jgi:hypothetical protein